MAKFVRNLSSALFLNGASSGVGEIPYVRAVEGRIWGIEPAPFFFTGAAFGNINHPAMLRFPFRTYRSLLVPARCSRPDGRAFPFIDSYGPCAAALSLRPASGPSAVSLAANVGRTTAGRFLAPVGRFSVWPELSWSVSAWAGPASVAGARRSGGFGTAEKSDRTDRSRSLVRNAVCREGRSPVRKSECAKAPRGPRIAWSKRGSSVRHRAAPARRRTACAFRFAFLGS